MVTLLGRVAEVGRLSANAKDAFNSFAMCILMCDKNVVFPRVTNIATNNAVLRIKSSIKSFIKHVIRDKS